MVDQTGRPGDGDGKNPSDKEADLSARLRRLDARLDEISARHAPPAPETPAASGMSGLGKAMRLSAEFISGVLTGALIGWVVDYWVGSSPWGLIVGLLLGFCAGMLNMYRAAGRPDGDASEDDGRGGSSSEPPQRT